MNYQAIQTALDSVKQDDGRRMAFLIELEQDLKRMSNDATSIGIRVQDEIEALAERQGLVKGDENVSEDVEMGEIEIDYELGAILPTGRVESLKLRTKPKSKRKSGRPRKAKG